MKMRHFLILCSCFAFLGISNVAFAQENVLLNTERETSNAFKDIYNDVLNDKAEIIVQDKDFVNLYCPEQKECRLKYSDLANKIHQQYDKEKMDTWKKTDCGVSFGVKVLEYDCGLDKQADMILNFTGRNEFDCIDTDDSGDVVFIHKNADGNFYLTQTWNNWTHYNIEIYENSEYRHVESHGMGVGNFYQELGKINANCQIEHFYDSLKCSDDCYESKDGEEKVFCAERYDHGKVTAGFCWGEHPALLEAWKKSCSMLEKRLSGILRFEHPLADSVKTSKELGFSE